MDLPHPDSQPDSGDPSLSAAVRPTDRSSWQPRAVLLLVLPVAALYALLQTVDVPSVSLLVFAAGVSVALAALTFALRAARLAAACLGGLLAYCYALTPARPHSAFWLLLATLVLTLGATRLSRRLRAARAKDTNEPEHERKHGRSAAQVAANLGVGALCGTLINSHGEVLAQIALAAALAEAAADTLASEIGSLSPGQPRMLLTGRRAEPGTDGAISLLGTFAAICGAAAIAVLSIGLFGLPPRCALVAWAAGFAGMLFDSVLGQVLEQRGWLHNDMVNFLSTLAAAGLALSAGRFFLAM
jgi:uncharacterized protein (TIGR00297 family)